WNRKVINGVQRYNCGNTSSTNLFHVAASSYHTGGVNVAMADGAVRLVADAIDFTTLRGPGPPGRGGGPRQLLPPARGGACPPPAPGSSRARAESFFFPPKRRALP